MWTTEAERVPDLGISFALLSVVPLGREEVTRRGDDGGYSWVNWLSLSVAGFWSRSTLGRLNNV